VAEAQPPPTAAPVPSEAAADVIALFSDAYDEVPVDTWRADWSAAGALADETIAGDAVKHYASVQYVGVEFVSQPINATAMTHFHVDIWTPDSTEVRVKLVDFGANGAYQGGDDSEHELTFTSTSTPALVQGECLGLDLPLSSFSSLRSRGHVAQIVLSGSNSTLYVDNVYFHR
jgi:hypothetical protein